jgi:hypothetical protein
MNDSRHPFPGRRQQPAYLADIVPPPAATASDEDSCPAFGYLRGVQDAAVAVEFRLRSGDSEWFAYNCLVSFRHNPSVGLLLKFTGDMTSLVLIHGSNLDAPAGEGTVNLTDRGLQRYRVTFVREMDEDELRRVGNTGPTIDRIDIAEVETVQEQREWLRRHAPAFLRSPS